MMIQGRVFFMRNFEVTLLLNAMRQDLDKNGPQMKEKYIEEQT